MKHFRKFFTLILALALTVSVLGGCTSRTTVEEPEETEETVPTAAPTPTPTPTPAAETEEPEPTPLPYTNPLTGEGLEEPVTTRVWAVMINDYYGALPQCGVSEADIIYETLAEGGITRMMAIFTDIRAAETLGSIRSIRDYYVSIGMAYDAVTVHAGYSPAAQTMLAQYDIDNIDGVGGSFPEINPFYRDSSRGAYGSEHTLFTTGEDLWDCAESYGYELEADEDADYGLHFTEDGTPDGEDAGYVCVTFTSKTTSFVYDEETQLYGGYQYGSEYTDANTGDQLQFTNLLVLSASISVVDSVGRVDVGLIGSGSGWFVCGGKYVEITWERESLYDNFHYYLTDGSELELGVGKTYIGIIPTSGGSVEFEAEYTE